MTAPAPHDPSAISTLGDCVGLRGRMMLRMSSEHDESRDVGKLPVLVLETAPQAAANSSAATAATAAAPTHPLQPNGPASAIASVDRCKSLKERIYDRSTRPLRAHEVVKDMYAHEQPFPVDTVFELDRVQLPPEPNRPETQSLLMAAEAAALVRSLETRLGETLHRLHETEEKLTKTTAELATVKMAHATKDKEASEQRARGDEVTRQLDLAKREVQTAAEAARAQLQTQMNQAVQAEAQRWDAQLKDAQALINNLKADLAGSEGDKKVLEAVVSELKEQLAQNTVALQTHAHSMRQMTNDLVAAKQQASTVALGLQTKDKQQRDLQTSLRLLQAELETLKPVAAQVAQVKDENAKLLAQMAANQQQVANVAHLETERARLASLVVKFEAEMPAKDRELMTLKQQLDAVRSQASAAYEHTSRFNAGESGGGMPMGSINRGFDGNTAGYYGGGGQHIAAASAPPSSNPAAAALRREIEEEERRANEDMKRWRTRLAGPGAPGAK